MVQATFGSYKQHLVGTSDVMGWTGRIESIMETKTGLKYEEIVMMSGGRS